MARRQPEPSAALHMVLAVLGGAHPGPDMRKKVRFICADTEERDRLASELDRYLERHRIRVWTRHFGLEFEFKYREGPYDGAHIEIMDVAEILEWMHPPTDAERECVWLCTRPSTYPLPPPPAPTELPASPPPS